MASMHARIAACPAIALAVLASFALGISSSAIHPPRQPLRDGGVAGRVAGEDVVRLREVARVVVRRPSDADGHRRDERAGVVEGLHGGHEALLRDVTLLAPEEVLLGDAAVLEHQLGGLARAEAHLVLDAT